MDAEQIHILQSMYNITHIPLSLLDETGEILVSFPSLDFPAVRLLSRKMVLEDFRLHKRDIAHPIINYLDPGFFLSTMELAPNRYLLICLVSPLPRTRADTIKLIASVSDPNHLQELCSLMLQMPLVSLDQLHDLLVVLSKLLLHRTLQREDILFMDISSRTMDAVQPEMAMFQQREHNVQHESIDFETAVLNAIERGNPSQLLYSVNAPRTGQIGRMSEDDLQQEKFSFVALATLVCRAAIRGGISVELAFSLSDLYCQRADHASDNAQIQTLSVQMMMDYCERVRQEKNNPAVSPVIRHCLAYISTHLHEPISLPDLAEASGLCQRSLSQTFKAEMGTSIVDFIHEERIKEAEYLLRHTDFSLSLISSYLNYSSQSYFTRIFREKRGITPQQYRDRAI